LAAQAAIETPLDIAPVESLLEEIVRGFVRSP
jgi:hypothetical protein